MATYAEHIATGRPTDVMLPVATYCVFALLSIVLLHPTAMDMVATWFQSSSHHHAVAVIPLAIWMISQRPRVTLSTNLSALPAVMLAVIIWLCGRAAGVALIEQLAFVSLLIAGVGVMFGSSALRQWAIPLLFLYFMVPFGTVLIPVLQQATAAVVVAMLGAIGMPIVLEGVLIKTPAGLFRIAEACAGLNFLLAALMIACVYAAVSLQAMRKRILFLVSAVGIALIANFLRAFLLIWIATITDMRVAVGADHLAIGLAFYAAVFAVLLFVGERLRGRHAFSEHAPVTARRPWQWPVALIALVPIILGAFYSQTVIDNASETKVPSALTPFNAPGWRLQGPPENWTPSLNADRRIGASYINNQNTVYMATSYVTHDRRGREIVNYNNQSWNDKDWRKISSQSHVIECFWRCAGRAY